jgi:hypothetical protein
MWAARLQLGMAAAQADLQVSVERTSLPAGHEGRPDEQLWNRLRVLRTHTDAAVLEGDIERVYKAEQGAFEAALSPDARKRVKCDHLLAVWTAAYAVDIAKDMTAGEAERAQEAALKVAESWLKRKVAKVPEDGLLDAAEVSSAQGGRTGSLETFETCTFSKTP